MQLIDETPRTGLFGLQVAFIHPEAAMPRPIAATSVVRNAQVACQEVATGTTISALTSSRPTVRIPPVTVTAAITETSRL